MDEKERLKHEALHDFMKQITRDLAEHMEGKEKTGLLILGEVDELTDTVHGYVKFCGQENLEQYSEEKLTEVLEYLQMVRGGLQEYLKGDQK